METLVSTNFREYVQLNFQPSFGVEKDDDAYFKRQLATKHSKKFDEPLWSSVVQRTVKPKTVHKTITRPSTQATTLSPTPFQLPPPMLSVLQTASGTLSSPAPSGLQSAPTSTISSAPISKSTRSSAPTISKIHTGSPPTSTPLLPFPTQHHFQQSSFFFNDFFQSMSARSGNNSVNYPLPKSISKLRQSILASGETPTQTLHHSYWDSRHGRWVTILYTCFGDVKAQINAKTGTFNAFGSGYKDAGIEIQQYTSPIVRHEITYQYGEIAIALDHNVWTIVFPCERYKFETSITLQ